MSSDIPRPASPSGVSDRVAFARAFLRRPGAVGSILPSSRFLQRRLVEMVAPWRATTIVELGPGIGGITRALLSAMPPGTRLLAIERDRDCAECVRRIDDARLLVHTGDARDLPAILSEHQWPPAQAIVSGLPFSSMPAAVATTLVGDIYDALSPRGVFVAYQLRRTVVDRARPFFGTPAARRVLLNAPPLQLFKWQKGAGDDADRSW